MRIFGYDIQIKAQRALGRGAKRNGRDSLADIMPPFGTNPPAMSRPFDGSMTDRAIHADPRESFYLMFPSKLTPAQVLMILRSALGGDLWQQWQLFSLMLDSWPMLRKCTHELRSAVSQSRFVVSPHAEPGKDPSKRAKAKADLVSKAIISMRPDPATDEKGFQGLVYDLSDAFVNGLVMVELLWSAGSENLPRASAWVHPRHYTFTNGGRIVVVDTNWRDYQTPDLSKFIIGQFNSRSGSVLGAGMLRPLAWWWSAVMYNREWMLNFAQKFGAPFRWATYRGGTPANELQQIDEMLENIGNAGWGRFVEGTNVQFLAQGQLGPHQPNVAIMEQANTECQLLILGQTLTTDVGDSGSRALGEVHKSVRRERVEEVAHWVADVLTEQFASAICRLNFGDDDERPTIQPDFTEAIDPLKTAQTYDIFVKSSVPIVAEEFYRENKLKMPEQGDKVLVGGKLGKLGSTDEEISAQPSPPPVPGQQPNGQPKDLELAGDLKAFSVIMARMSRHKATENMPDEIRDLLRKAGPMLAKATADDLEHVRDAVNALIKAGDEHFEQAAMQLKDKLKQFARIEPKRAAGVLRDTMAAAWFNGAVAEAAPLKNGKVKARSNGHDVVDRAAAVVVLRGNEVLLVKRKFDPEKGKLGLPGGHVHQGESTQDAAARELREETGVESGKLTFLDNTPDGSVTFYMAEVESGTVAKAGTDAATAEWHDVAELPDLAFGNNSIVSNALSKVKAESMSEEIDAVNSRVDMRLAQLNSAVGRLETALSRPRERKLIRDANGRIIAVKDL